MAAYLQAPWVARINHIPLPVVKKIIGRHVHGRFLGMYGNSYVNVLEPGCENGYISTTPRTFPRCESESQYTGKEEEPMLNVASIGVSLVLLQADNLASNDPFFVKGPSPMSRQDIAGRSKNSVPFFLVEPYLIGLEAFQ